jgi:hypothetical protein
MEERNKKIGQIKSLFSKLYFFTSDEADSIMKSIMTFPDAGLDAFIKVLEDEMKQQNIYLENQIKSDPRFTKNLERFLKKTTRKIINQYEEGQKKEAEKILEDI